METAASIVDGNLIDETCSSEEMRNTGGYPAWLLAVGKTTVCGNQTNRFIVICALEVDAGSPTDSRFMFLLIQIHLETNF